MEILHWVGVRNEGGFNLHISIFTLISAQKSRVHQLRLTRRHPQSPPLRPSDSIMPSPTHLLTTAYRVNATLSKVDADVDSVSIRASMLTCNTMKRSVTPSQKEQAAGLSASSVWSAAPSGAIDGSERD